MKITIRKPLGYSQIGRKDQQEDAVWPLFADVSKGNRCFVLCDGVGGSEHGEVASQTSSKTIGEYLSKVIAERDYVTEDDVQEAIKCAYDELEKIDNPSEDGTVSMATTLTCVCLHKDGVVVAHIGDSRIYAVRPSQGLLYQSADHSLVNALLQAGEITIEEAKNFPRKNVITKAIQPNSKKRFNAEVYNLTDIQSGDYLFLCCDGVLEQLTNDRLIEILSMDISDEDKIKLLEEESTDRTKDNYTAYLIPIDKVKGTSDVETANLESELECEVLALEETPDTKVSSEPSEPQNVTLPFHYFNKRLIIICLVIVVLAALAIIWWKLDIDIFGLFEQSDSETSQGNENAVI